MAVKKPDEYQHNNPNLALVDSNFIRGGERVVSNLSDLYALSSKSDQLKVNVTKVTVLADGYQYKLIDSNNIGNSAGWKKLVESTPEDIDGKLNVGANVSLESSETRIMAAAPDGTPQSLFTPRDGFEDDTDIITAIKAADYSSQNAQYIVPAGNKIFQAGKMYWELGITYLAWRDNFSVRVSGPLNTILYKSVATHAAMVADGAPVQLIVYKVLNDETRSLANTIYQWWPDGVRTYITSTID